MGGGIKVRGLRGLEHVPKFKYLKYDLDESDTDNAECCRRVANVRNVTGAIKSLV